MVSGAQKSVRTTAAMSHSKKIRLTLRGLSAPIEFSDCPELAKGIGSILRGWNIKEVPLDGPVAPVMRFRKTSRGYQRISAWTKKPSLARDKIRRSVMSAIGGFNYELFNWYNEEHPTHLYLHAAAAEFDGGLVVFPSIYKTGKSTFVTQLAAIGHRVFCDDVLVIEPDRQHGLALGIMPRLRLPLPANVDGDFKAFLGRRRGPHHARYLYVMLKNGELAPLGTTAPIRGLVHLERMKGRRTTLVASREQDMLKGVIRQNFANRVPSLDVLDRLRIIAGNAECFTLRYSNGRRAAELLQSHFGPFN